MKRKFSTSVAVAALWTTAMIVFPSMSRGQTPPPIGGGRPQHKAAIDHLLSKGIATLVIDPFTPRNEPEGVCANLDEKRATQYFTRGGNDVLAALNVLEAMPDIDTKHIFLQGYCYGTISSLFATDRKNPANHAKIAGIVAYYPYCYDGVDPSVPALVVIGEKDDWTPAARCQAVTGKTDLDVGRLSG
jgi:dienelactone hydrolase